MTQPPQWGAPPRRPVPPPHYQAPPPGHGFQRQQHWPQQGPPPGWLPPKPAQLTLLAVLNWILAVGMLLIAAFVIVSFLMSGGTLLVGVLLAAVIAGFGLLNALGALSVNHPHFPNIVASQLAGAFTGLVLVVALVRSVRRGVAELLPSIGSAVLLALCVLSLVLASLPAVKRWILAKHQHSLLHGHVPRNRR